LKPTREQIEHRAIELMRKKGNFSCKECRSGNETASKCLIKGCGNEIVETYLEIAEKELSKPILTEDEKVILKNLSKGFEWIVRGQAGLLYLYTGSDKPVKGEFYWLGYHHDFYMYNHLFQFITWEDEEPYNIEELLNEAD